MDRHRGLLILGNIHWILFNDQFLQSQQSLQATHSYHYNPNIVAGGLKAQNTVNSVTVRTRKGHTSKHLAIVLSSVLSPYEKEVFLKTLSRTYCTFSYFKKISNIKMRISFTQGIPKGNHSKRNKLLENEICKEPHHKITTF